MAGISTRSKALELYQTFAEAGVAVRSVIVTGKEIRLTLSDEIEQDEMAEPEGLGGVNWSKS